MEASQHVIVLAVLATIVIVPVVALGLAACLALGELAAERPDFTGRFMRVLSVFLGLAVLASGALGVTAVWISVT